jgi:hypothetical protein
MPVGPYPDFASCVADNQDKDDPEAYCASLESGSLGAMWIIADVEFDTDSEAREAERLAREGKLAGLSVDLGDVTAELEILDVDDDGFPVDWLETVTDAEIIGATQVAMPAFADARIEFGDSPVAFLAPEGAETSDRRLIEAGALRWRDPAPLMFTDTTDERHQGAVFVGNLTNFRRQLVASIPISQDWLVDPRLAGLTKPSVEAGRLVGHGAGWGTCHTAFKDACITAPHSGSDYAYVGEQVNVYKHPGGDQHAPLHLDLDTARNWYQNHCELVGLAAVGEDDHGVWVSGSSVLPDGELFLSGDWRSVDGDLELISFLVVENPGFPTALVAADTQTALCAAGIVTGSEPLAARITRLETLLAGIEQERQADRLLADLLS